MTLAYTPPTVAQPPAHHCPQGSRDCFPHELTQRDDDSEFRGSGRIAWYRLRLGGFVPVQYEDGTVNQKYAWEGTTVALRDDLSFAATMAALRAEAAAYRPDMELVNYWGTEEPSSEF